MRKNGLPAESYTHLLSFSLILSEVHFFLFLRFFHVILFYFNQYKNIVEGTLHKQVSEPLSQIGCND